MNRARLVGVIHLPPLPGSPRSALSAREIAKAAARDAKVLEDAGFDLAMIENYGDMPFFAKRVPAVTVSAMTACALAVRERCPELAIGINVLRNDAQSALAIAAIVDAACIRVNVHTGARVTDQGIIEGAAARTLRARRALGANHVELWCDVDVKHSAPLAPRAIGDEARDLAERAMADAILVTGEGTGRVVDRAKLDEVLHAVPEVPIFIASGVTTDALPELASRARGVIVGSALRKDGLAGGPIDEARAHDFARGFARAFRKDFA